MTHTHTVATPPPNASWAGAKGPICWLCRKPVIVYPAYGGLVHVEASMLNNRPLPKPPPSPGPNWVYDEGDLPWLGGSYERHIKPGAAALAAALNELPPETTVLMDGYRGYEEDGEPQSLRYFPEDEEVQIIIFDA
jgi:hypothetical protein